MILPPDFFICLSSEPDIHRCSSKLMFLIIFSTFTGKYLRQSLYFNKVAASNFVNFAKFLEQVFNRRPSEDCFCFIRFSMK